MTCCFRKVAGVKMVEDCTFITNEGTNNLLDRFNVIIKGTKFFDCLVGYFYSSGFHLISSSLEKTDKIRILIGISTNKETFDLIQSSKGQIQLNTLSHKETKEHFSHKIVEEMESSEDKMEVEDGIRKFIKWLKSGKLEIRAYNKDRVHAKLYIMKFNDNMMDYGRVITGSSNFTRAGLKDNLEFNVELKDRADYDFALNEFEKLWKESVDVSEEYVETVNEKTWLNDSITPYELYLKFLYEYLKDKINADKEEIKSQDRPENFMDLEYQRDAVIDAKMKLEEYGGVFISDVVGLGKTYICAMLAQQLTGRTLVIAPPILLDKNNPGSWPNVFGDFGVGGCEFESRGKLDSLIERGTSKFRNVIIDEAHDFRNESTQSYAKLSQICQGKRVILVSATPLNNSPTDILSQIKLFQNAHKSTLPHPEVRDLEKYFKKLQKRLNGLDRNKDKEEYLKIVQENANDIREKVLQYIMVRRTRSSITKYYGKDLEKQGLKFPDVKDPAPAYYSFDEDLDTIFNETVELITKRFTYSRYTPLLYLKRKLTAMEATSQRNMGKFMKILLLKRLESSFYAFKQSIGRFIYSYTKFIDEYREGNVYVSKKYINKIFELVEIDDMEAVEKIINEGKASRYDSFEFDSDFINDLENDLKVLKRINTLWKDVDEDPKLEEFINMIYTDPNLKDNKLIIFTESKETACYLRKNLNKHFGKALYFSGDSKESVRKDIIKNFDAKHPKPKDDYRILISTDVLSQGVNLHRSNVVINYDIPWNPTRMMQRVGRVQRVDSKFSEIYTYNFFPAGPINENISLEEAAEAKIAAFIEMLGNDSKLLTDEEIKSHDLFSRLTSKEVITGEDEEEDYELKYLKFLREIRDEYPELFQRIKKLPKKARTARRNEEVSGLVTFFQKGKLRKIFLTKGIDSEELDFLEAAQILEAGKTEGSLNIGSQFYEYLNINKGEFESVFDVEEVPRSSGGSTRSKKLMKLINAVLQIQKDFTDRDEEYVRQVLELLDNGVLPKAITKNLQNAINSVEDPNDTLGILSKIRSEVPSEYLTGQDEFESSVDLSGPMEVILSEYFVKGE